MCLYVAYILYIHHIYIYHIYIIHIIYIYITVTKVSFRNVKHKYVGLYKKEYTCWLSIFIWSSGCPWGNWTPFWNYIIIMVWFPRLLLPHTSRMGRSLGGIYGGRGCEFVILAFWKNFCHGAVEFHHPVPRHKLQPAHLHLRQPPASWPSILLVFPFAGHLVFWSGCLSLILYFVFLVLWSSGLPSLLVFINIANVHIRGCINT